MKIKDVRKKGAADLKKLIVESEAELRAYRFGSAGAAKKNARASREIRKTIARAKTILNESK